MEEREVLIYHRYPEFARGHRPASGEQIEFEATGTSLEKSLFLVVASKGDSPQIELSVNGDAVTDEWIRGKAGLWLHLPTESLREGKNVISLRGGAPVSYAVVALETAGEEAHFQRYFAASPSRNAQPPNDPNMNQWDAQRIDLALTMDMTAPAANTAPRIAAATATITNRSLVDGLTTCVLDFDVNGGAIVVSGVDAGTEASPLTYTLDTANDRIRITLASPVNTGEDYVVRVRYSGRPVFGEGYLYRGHGTGSAVPLVYTNSQPYAGRTWFPSKDVPEDKVLSSVAITCPTTVYDGYPLFGVSNGTLTETRENGDSTRTYAWDNSYPISTYLIVANCTNYRKASGTYTALDGVTTMEVAHLVYPESYSVEAPEVPNTITVMEFFAETFGEYPFLREKYWTATWGLTFGMEHQTVSSMPDKQLQTPFSRRNVHELAHMWFGDYVTLEHYDHLWLNEGWATYCEALFYEWQQGRTAYFNYVNAWTTSDVYPIVSSNADLFNNSVAYRKGGFVLHMLRKVMGDEKFFAGARAYLKAPGIEYNVALSEDFERIMEETSGMDLTAFFQQWLYRASRPNYQYSWSWAREGADAIVQLGITQIQTDLAYVMPVDLRVTYSDSTTQTFTVQNTSKSQTFTLNIGTKTPSTITFDPENWILKTGASLVGAPPAPVLRSVIANASTDEVIVTWDGATGATGYRLFMSPDGVNDWTMILDETTLDASARTATVGRAVWGGKAYFRVLAQAIGTSAPSDTYGARLTGSDLRVLIVDGYDRWNSQSFSGGLNHTFGAMHGQAVAAADVDFNTVANESAATLTVLNEYPMLVWAAGDDSSVDDALNATEVTNLTAYLQGGGRLFLSGNEVAYDLARAGRPAADVAFVNNYLKATYTEDASANYNLVGAGNVQFGTAEFSFGGAGAGYLPSFPDVIAPANGSETVLRYGNAKVAGVAYSGTFGTGTLPGRVMFTGFGFETLDGDADRADFMRRVLRAMAPEHAQPDGYLDSWMLR